jgi:hypothetical protein
MIDILPLAILGAVLTLGIIVLAVVSLRNDVTATKDGGQCASLDAAASASAAIQAAKAAPNIANDSRSEQKTTATMAATPPTPIFPEISESVADGSTAPSETISRTAPYSLTMRTIALVALAVFIVWVAIDSYPKIARLFDAATPDPVADYKRMKMFDECRENQKKYPDDPFWRNCFSQ